MKPIHLVTGGCGFVGRHLVRALIAQGADVYIVDDLSTGFCPSLWLAEEFAEDKSASAVGRRGPRLFRSASGQCITFEKADILTALMQQLGAARADADVAADVKVWPAFADAFHLASIVGGRHKIENDPLHVGVDLAIDALFFRWLTAAPNRAKRVLYASSSAAYPIHLQKEQGHVALREDMLDMGRGRLGQPDMSYGYSKMTGEYLAHLAASHYGISVACVRPFSGYGEDQETVYPVPAIAARVAAQEAPVTVWGTGEQGRDFVHIDDCIRAILLAVERIHDGSAVNIGTGKLTTFLELAALFLRLDGRPNDGVRPLAGQPVGVASRYCDPSHMQKVLGFTPAITLEAGMGRVLQAARARASLRQQDSAVEPPISRPRSKDRAALGTQHAAPQHAGPQRGGPQHARSAP